MNILITITSTGVDTGPFNLYSNVDGFISAFGVGISKAALLAGYSTIVPDDTTVVRIMSNGVCKNYIDVIVSESQAQCDAGMDVVFLIDYTGSMGGAITNLKSSITNIVSAIVTNSNNNYRLGLVIFDEYSSGTVSNYSSRIAYTSLPSEQKFINVGLNGKFQWLTTLEKMQTNNESSFTAELNLLNTINFPLGNGQGAPEPSDIGVNIVSTNNVSGYEYFAGTFRSRVSKLIILITDDAPGGNDDVYNQTDIDFVNSLIPQLVSQNIRVLLMTTANYNVLYDLATQTNGLVSNGFAGADIITALENICISTTTTTTTIAD